VIERIMCDYRVDLGNVCSSFDADPRALLKSASSLDGLIADGIVRREGNVVALEDKARPLVRVLAAAFDQYLGDGPARHSRAV
jgi:oxygen-independent coproporphyrinogen-3 oxidase